MPPKFRDTHLRLSQTQTTEKTYTHTSWIKLKLGGNLHQQTCIIVLDPPESDLS